MDRKSAPRDKLTKSDDDEAYENWGNLKRQTERQWQGKEEG